MMNVSDSPGRKLFAELAGKEERTSTLHCSTMLCPTLLPTALRDTYIEKTIVWI
jgi:hypothetical protein